MNCSTLFTLFFNKIVGVDLVVALYTKKVFGGGMIVCALAHCFWLGPPCTLVFLNSI